jgi:hypothetical protein
VCCLAERRAIETIDDGEPKTPWLQHGDRVRIECVDADGRSLFGAIEQRVVTLREGAREVTREVAREDSSDAANDAAAEPQAAPDPA